MARRNVRVMVEDPVRLVLLVVPFAVAWSYLWTLRRRRRDTVRFTSLELLESVMSKDRWRALRHVPMALLASALLLFVVGFAGPISNTDVPRSRSAVILVLDVSLSMQAKDVQPDRITAAKEAAKTFARRLPPEVNLSLVSFAGTASVLTPPSRDRETALRSIDSLTLAESTATGEAIFTALQDVRTFNQQFAADPPAPGESRIVLLSDGKQTVPAVDGENEARGSFSAARIAAQESVPIDTISFGTSYGSIQLEGVEQSVAVDDASMRSISEIAKGRFYTASSLEELNQVYSELTGTVGYETVRRKNSEPWYLAGSVLTALAASFAVAFGRRIP